MEPTRADLFLAFLKLGLLGFGGVGPQARHVIVVERRWLDEAEYAQLIGLCQVLPGANTVNAAVMIGDRFAGWPGAVVAVAGLMAGPLAVVALLAGAYGWWGGVPAVQSALGGAAAAAAGLVLASGVRHAWAMGRKGTAGLTIAAAAVAIGLFRLPLAPVALALAPVAVALSWIGRRHG